MNFMFCRAALVASQVLPSITRGDTYQQVEWVLLDAHSQLLDIMMATNKDDVAWIAQRSQYLSSLMHQSTIPQGPQLLDLQLKVNPCRSKFTFLMFYITFCSANNYF